MQKIILLKGLPASGKSTWAKQYCLDNPNFVRVNKDDIREILGNPKFTREFEDKVLALERQMGLAAIKSGQSLIVDSTNFAKKHEKYWTEIATQNDLEIEIKYFDTPLDTCIERDSEREKSVGKDVIVEMYTKYIIN